MDSGGLLSRTASPDGDPDSDGDGDGDPDPDAEPTRQEVFETLSNERRRMVARFLRSEGETELRELSREIAARENHTEPAVVTSEQRRRVYNALQQSHLPKMDDHGVVDYDRARGTVRPVDGLDDVTMYLEVVPDRDIAWSTYYILLGTTLLSLSAAVALDVYPFSLFGLAPTALGSALLVVASGLVHRRRQRSMKIGSEGPPTELGE